VVEELQFEDCIAFNLRCDVALCEDTDDPPSEEIDPMADAVAPIVDADHRMANAGDPITTRGTDIASVCSGDRSNDRGADEFGIISNRSSNSSCNSADCGFDIAGIFEDSNTAPFAPYGDWAEAVNVMLAVWMP
jgi:hypothetical protein